MKKLTKEEKEKSLNNLLNIFGMIIGVSVGYNIIKEQCGEYEALYSLYAFSQMMTRVIL